MLYEEPPEDDTHQDLDNYHARPMMDVGANRYRGGSSSRPRTQTRTKKGPLIRTHCLIPEHTWSNSKMVQLPNTMQISSQRTYTHKSTRKDAPSPSSRRYQTTVMMTLPLPGQTASKSCTMEIKYPS